MTAFRNGLPLVAALLLVGCGGDGSGHSGSRVPDASEIGGTYDLTTTVRGSAQPSHTGVGVLTVGDELHVELSDPPVALSGALQRDGSVRLEGRTTLSDVIEARRAIARVRRIGDAYWLTGTIQTLDMDFAMTRPVGSDLRSASGRYRLTFPVRLGNCECASTIDLDADIGVDGGSILAPAHATDEHGDTLADLSSATLDVAPSRRFHLDATYVEPGGGCGVDAGPCLLRVDGILPQTVEIPAHYELLSGVRMRIAAGDLQIGRIE